MRHLSLVLMAACLCVGCATKPHAQSDALVSNIVRGQSANLVCRPGDVRMCVIDDDAEKHCTCMDHSEVFPRR